MQQLIQALDTGQTRLEDVPRPLVPPGHVLIQTRYSLVSAGTERMLVEFGRASLLGKVRQQPDKVKQVLDKIRTDGLLPTLEAVFNRLGEPLPLGYCNAGVVLEAGEGVTHFRPGDRVASNGPHAELVSVPVNLCARIPDGVSDEEAAFTVIGAVALQGIRLAAPTLGETVVVQGLGLVGLLTADLLRANGCRVIGFDFDEQKVQLAVASGVKAYNLTGGADPVAVVLSETGGRGADAVLITAATKSNEVVAQAARMSRQRGRLVLTGVVGLHLNRADFYEKELTFQVSCSYGPGRYDDDYEEKGHDYPLPFVRWTAGRNFEAVLEAIAAGRLNVKRLITEVVPLAEFNKVYGNLGGGNIASLLRYLAQIEAPSAVATGSRTFPAGQGTVAVIGAGNYTKMTLLPALTRLKAPVQYIVSANGLSGTSLARKYKIPVSATDYAAVLADPAVKGVILTTRHHLHAEQTIQALQAGKHVFVEKPLVINADQLVALQQVYAAAPTASVTVGFNRRFSPYVQKMKSLLGAAPEGLSLQITVNAGALPADHWTQDMAVGGGRIIGEACHFIDLVSYLAGSPLTAVTASALGRQPARNADSVTVVVRCQNGSQGVINYLANGHKAYPKERLEAFHQGRVLVLDNFRRLAGYGFRNFSSASGRQDKGHAAGFAAWLHFLEKGGEPPIAWAEILNSSQASLAAVEAFTSQTWLAIN